MDRISEALCRSLVEKLDGFKFVKSKWHLIKKNPDGWQALVIEALPTAAQGVLRLECHGHLRINEIEDIYTPYHLFLTEKDAKNHPTVVVNVDRLLSDKSFIEGFIDDPNCIESFATRYAAALQSDVLPWLDKYSNEELLLEGLIDGDPSKWITSDRLARFPVLLAILAKRKQGGEFDRVANEFLSYCEKPHAQVYKPLADSIISGLKK